MPVVLRDFLYLDGKVVRSYLASLEGGVFEEETVTERKGTEAGGGVSAGLPGLTLGGKGSRTTGTEITRQSSMSDDAPKPTPSYQQIVRRQLTGTVWEEERLLKSRQHHPSRESRRSSTQSTVFFHLRSS
jgi:hypothetical protein